MLCFTTCLHCILFFICLFVFIFPSYLLSNFHLCSLYRTPLLPGFQLGKTYGRHIHQIRGWQKKKRMGVLYPGSLPAGLLVGRSQRPVLKATAHAQQSSFLPSPNRGSLLTPGRSAGNGFPLPSSLWPSTLCWLSLIHSLPLLTVPLWKQLWIPAQGLHPPSQDADLPTSQLSVGSTLGGEREGFFGALLNTRSLSPCFYPLCSEVNLIQGAFPDNPPQSLLLISWGVVTAPIIDFHQQSIPLTAVLCRSKPCVCLLFMAAHVKDNILNTVNN